MAQMRRILGPSGRNMQLKGRIGFSNLPDQLVNKEIKKGFDFNILCVGETGIGKSTMMETLFKTKLDDVPVTHKQPEVSMTEHSYELHEGNVNLRLTVVSTAGFGDQISRENSHIPIVNYIEKQFESYLQEELNIRRNLVDYHDTRVHICVYFISPTGHTLKSLDLACMKELDSRVNIIPVIAKSDTISRPDLIQFKKQLMEELGSNGIKIYTFPSGEQPVGELNAKMNDHIPFGVVGSKEEIIAGGKRIRARQYPWGLVEVENEAHCESAKLREMLIRTNMQDLRERTHTVHYQLYRSNRMTRMGFTDVTPDNKPVSLQEIYQQKRNEHLKEMHAREEHMRAMFVQKVKEKESDLKAAEQRLIEDQERIREQGAEDKKALDKQRLLLEDEITQFNKKKAQVQAQRAQTELMANNNITRSGHHGKK